MIALVADESDDLSSVPSAEEVMKKNSAGTNCRKDNPTSETDKGKDSETAAVPPGKSSNEATSNPIDVHSTRPMFPSVMRLAHTRGIKEPEKEIRGTGLHGMITKGDVLAYLGDIKSAFGSAKDHHTTLTELGGVTGGKKGNAHKGSDQPTPSMGAAEHRRFVIDGLSSMSAARHATPRSEVHVSFNDIIEAYLPKGKTAKPGTGKQSSLSVIYEQLLK